MRMRRYHLCYCPSEMLNLLILLINLRNWTAFRTLFRIDRIIRAIPQHNGDDVDRRGHGDGLSAFVHLAGVGVLPGAADGQVWKTNRFQFPVFLLS